jgi:hypothetical protein
MKVNSANDLPSLKQELSAFLPSRICEVMNSYDAFAAADIPADAKGFAAYHSACKAALAHAETLLKIAKWSEETQDKESQTDDIKELLAEANEALNSMEDEEEYTYEYDD